MVLINLQLIFINKNWLDKPLRQTLPYLLAQSWKFWQLLYIIILLSHSKKSNMVPFLITSLKRLPARCQQSGEKTPLACAHVHFHCRFKVADSKSTPVLWWISATTARHWLGNSLCIQVILKKGWMNFDGILYVSNLDTRCCLKSILILMVMVPVVLKIT